MDLFPPLSNKERARIAILFFISLVISILSCNSEKGSIVKTDSISTSENVSLWDSTLKNIRPEKFDVGEDVFDQDTSGNIIPTFADDKLVAKSYPYWRDKGPFKDSTSFTIMTRSLHHRVGDTLHVIHIFENKKVNGEIRWAGPNLIHEEYINGKNYTDSAITGTLKKIKTKDGYELRGESYDGPVSFGSGVEYTNAITKYILREKGVYKIQWKSGENVSNVLTIQVE